jgi:hypothetical protein
MSILLSMILLFKCSCLFVCETFTRAQYYNIMSRLVFVICDRNSVSDPRPEKTARPC